MGVAQEEKGKVIGGNFQSRNQNEYGICTGEVVMSFGGRGGTNWPFGRTAKPWVLLESGRGYFR